MEQQQCKLTTRAVVTAYVEFRLVESGHESEDAFLGNCLAAHPVLETLRNIANSNMQHASVQKLCCSFKKKAQIVQGGLENRKAQNSYIRNVSSAFFARRGPLSNPDYSWPRVAMSMEVTSLLAEAAACYANMRRARELIEWCIQLYQEWQVNAWIAKQGGWNMAAEKKTKIFKRPKFLTENVKIVNTPEWTPKPEITMQNTKFESDEDIDRDSCESLSASNSFAKDDSIGPFAPNLGESAVESEDMNSVDGASYNAGEPIRRVDWYDASEPSEPTLKVRSRKPADDSSINLDWHTPEGEADICNAKDFSLYNRFSTRETHSYTKKYQVKPSKCPELSRVPMATTEECDLMGIDLRLPKDKEEFHVPNRCEEDNNWQRDDKDSDQYEAATTGEPGWKSWRQMHTAKPLCQRKCTVQNAARHIPIGEATRCGMKSSLEQRIESLQKVTVNLRQRATPGREAEINHPQRCVSPNQTQRCVSPNQTQRRVSPSQTQRCVSPPRNASVNHPRGDAIHTPCRVPPNPNSRFSEKKIEWLEQYKNEQYWPEDVSTVSESIAGYTTPIPFNSR